MVIDLHFHRYAKKTLLDIYFSKCYIISSDKSGCDFSGFGYLRVVTFRVRVGSGLWKFYTSGFRVRASGLFSGSILPYKIRIFKFFRKNTQKWLPFFENLFKVCKGISYP